jgi:rhomboid protease GluP
VDEDGRVELKRAFDAEALEPEVLLLAALGIPYDLVPDGDELLLTVDAAHAERARMELSRAEDEPEVLAPVLHGGVRSAIPTALALVGFHALLGMLPPGKREAIYRAGQLDAVKVRMGELGRTATALTLHADPGHVVGNALATAIFVSAAGDWVGPGLALFCTVLVGILGNLAAVAIDPHHLSIGFSTATFGALGLTSVFGFVARYRDRIQRKRAWLTLGAGIALLALTGAGERSDLLAHLFGLGAGALVGMFVTRARIRLGPVGQWIAALLAVALLALAWQRQLALS